MLPKLNASNAVTCVDICLSKLQLNGCHNELDEEIDNICWDVCNSLNNYGLGREYILCISDSLSQDSAINQSRCQVVISKICEEMKHTFDYNEININSVSLPDGKNHHRIQWTALSVFASLCVAAFFAVFIFRRTRCAFCSRSTDDDIDEDYHLLKSDESVDCRNSDSQLNRQYSNDCLDVVRRVVCFDDESKHIIHCSIPFVCQNLVNGLCEIVEIAIISHYLGNKQMTAYLIVHIFLGTYSEFLMGIGEATATLVSHAVGFGNNHLAGQYAQIATVIYTVCSIPVMVLLYFTIYPTIRWLGLDHETAEFGQKLVNVSVFSLALEGIGEIMEEFLCAASHEYFTASLDILTCLVNVLAVSVAIIKYDVELWFVGLIHLIVTLLWVIAMNAVAYYSGWLKVYLKGMLMNNAFENRVAVKHIVAASAPLALGNLLASAEYGVLMIFASYIGPDAVSTWGILCTVWETLEATTDGIGDASEIRVARHLGKGNPEQAKISSYKSIFFALIASFIVSMCCILLHGIIPAWFTPDPTIQQMLRDMIPLIGLANMCIAFGMVSWALVTAQGRMQYATIAVTLITWSFTIPLAALMIYYFRTGLEGAVIAVSIGYTLAGFVLLRTLYNSDWHQISKDIQEANGFTGECYSDDEDDSDSESKSTRLSLSSDSTWTTKYSSRLITNHIDYDTEECSSQD